MLEEDWNDLGPEVDVEPGTAPERLNKSDEFAASLMTLHVVLYGRRATVRDRRRIAAHVCEFARAIDADTQTQVRYLAFRDVWRRRRGAGPKDVSDEAFWNHLFTKHDLLATPCQRVQHALSNTWDAFVDLIGRCRPAHRRSEDLRRSEPRRPGNVRFQ